MRFIRIIKPAQTAIVQYTAASSIFISLVANCSLSSEISFESRYEKTVCFFAYAKTKTQISFAVTAPLISLHG